MKRMPEVDYKQARRALTSCQRQQKEEHMKKARVTHTFLATREADLWRDYIPYGQTVAVEKGKDTTIVYLTEHLPKAFSNAVVKDFIATLK